MTRPSVVVRVATSFAKNIPGLVFMAGGIALAAYGFQSEQRIVGYVGIGCAIFGAWIMPSIAPMITNVWVNVSPSIPLVGGRRSTDQPPKQP